MVWKRWTAGVVLTALALTGCSASADRGEFPAATCDGGASVSTPEKAAKILLDAASQADTVLACTVTTGTPKSKDLG